MLKLRGRGWVLKMESCLQASQLWDPQAGGKAGMGAQEGEKSHLPPREEDGGVPWRVQRSAEKPGECLVG